MAVEKITLGSKVLVSYPPDGQFLSDPARKFNGKEFIVKRKKVIMTSRAPRWYWELYGAESEYGIPYGFCEEDLIRI